MPETFDEAKLRAARTITRDQARDHAKYKEVSEAARAQGKEIIWLDPDASDPAPQAKVDVVFLRDHILVRREAARDPQEYRKLRAEADRSHRTLSLVEDLSAIGDPDLQRRVDEALLGQDPGSLRTTQDPLKTVRTVVAGKETVSAG
jgi:hypothetical protein